MPELSTTTLKTSDAVSQFGLQGVTKMPIDYKVLLPICSIFVLAYPGVRAVFEQSMVAHMLIQLPLLAVLGILIGQYVAVRYVRSIPYYFALPLLLVALFSAMFWMLPRVLDASLEHPQFVIAKFVMLPFLLGVPLVLAWKNIGAITKAFFIANLISMLVVLGWVYIEAPVRLCNFYLVNEQQLVGEALLYITAGAALWWIAKVFIGNPK